MQSHIRNQRNFLPADYIGSFGGALLPEMYHAVNQYDTDNHHVIELAVPGMSSDDIKVELKNPVLWITAQRTVKDPVSGKREVRGLPYQRTFIVPRACEADAVTANCKNGMLTIKVKKSKRNRISIPVSGGIVSEISWLRKLQESLFHSLSAKKKEQRK
jgi:HSP20 family molecular chaperone IbpA